MESKNREKLLLIATGACIALWLVNLLVISPLIDSWHSRSDEIERLKKEIADGAGLVRRESTIRDRWESMRANALNSNPTVAERQMLTAFDRWARAGSVTQGSFRPQVQETDTNFTTVDCRSDVSGSIKNVSDFLQAMTRDPLANKLDSFELTAKDDNGSQLTLDLTMNGLVLTDSISSMPPAMADSTPLVRDTNAASGIDLDPFKLITRNNIFNQSRRYNDDNAPVATVRAPTISMFTLCGASVDHDEGWASFSGSGASTSKFYKTGDSINDLKIAKITIDNVTLTNASNNFVLAVPSSLRREDKGPWRVSGDIAATPSPDGTSIGSASPASGSGTGANSIEEMMRKRREQEEK